MTDAYEKMAGSAAFEPTEADRASVRAWFERYDGLAAKGDVEGMADQAVFPLNVVTDSATGGGTADQVTREQFVAMMGGVVAGSADVSMESTRNPIFLSSNLVLVVTDATMKRGDQSQPVRYVDLLLRIDGDWRFQSMVQAGWG